MVDDLPAVVWVPWDRKGVGRYFKVPYLRLFLKYFVTYHIGRSLDTLNRHLLAIAALSSDPDANSSKREAVKLYLQSLPSPPYRILIFSAVLAALVIALPLQAFGNAFYVLDLVGAMLRSDVSYLSRALQGDEVGPTVRSLIVLLIGLIGVGALLTSPFGLKRMLFNLSVDQGASRLDRGQEPRLQGRRNLRPGRGHLQRGRHPASTGGEVGPGVPNLLALAPFGIWALHGGCDPRCLDVVGDLSQLGPWITAPETHFTLPVVSWAYYALFTGLVLAAFVSSSDDSSEPGRSEAERRDQLTPPGASMPN